MKRSTQVSLVLMAAAGIGATAYALSPSNNCRPPPPNTTPRDAALRDAGPNDAPRAAPEGCRTSGSGSSGRSYSSFFSSNSGSSGFGSSASTSNSTSAAALASNSASRGGFGSIGRAFASFSGGG